MKVNNDSAGTFGTVVRSVSGNLDPVDGNQPEMEARRGREEHGEETARQAELVAAPTGLGGPPEEESAEEERARTDGDSAAAPRIAAELSLPAIKPMPDSARDDHTQAASDPGGSTEAKEPPDDALAQVSTRYENLVAAYDLINREHGALRARAAALEEENRNVVEARLKAEAQAQESLRVAEQETVTGRKEVERLTSELNSTRESLRISRQEAEAGRKESERLTGELTAARKQTAQLQEKLQGELATLKAQLETVKKETGNRISALSQQTEQQEQQIQHLRRELSAQHGIRQRLEARVQEVEGELESARTLNKVLGGTAAASVLINLIQASQD